MKIILDIITHASNAISIFDFISLIYQNYFSFAKEKIIQFIYLLDFDTCTKIIVSCIILFAIKITNSLSETDKMLKNITLEVHQNNTFLMEDLKLKMNELEDKISKLKNKIIEEKTETDKLKDDLNDLNLMIKDIDNKNITLNDKINSIQDKNNILIFDDLKSKINDLYDVNMKLSKSDFFEDFDIRKLNNLKKLKVYDYLLINNDRSIKTEIIRLIPNLEELTIITEIIQSWHWSLVSTSVTSKIKILIFENYNNDYYDFPFESVPRVIIDPNSSIGGHFGNTNIQSSSSIPKIFSNSLKEIKICSKISFGIHQTAYFNNFVNYCKNNKIKFTYDE